jgi:hypothetical protein
MGKLPKIAAKHNATDCAGALVCSSTPQGDVLSPGEGARLDALEAAIKGVRGGLERMRAGLADFVEGVLQTATALNEARKLFASNKDFGDWLRASGLGEDALNKNDRAALIDFGEDPKRARAILEASERKSLRLIHQHEWKSPPLRLPTGGKTECSSRPLSASAGEAKPPSADPIDAVARMLILKCADGVFRPLPKLARLVGCAESAAREALKRLGAETGRSGDGLEYRLADERDEPAGCVDWANVLARKDAEITDLKQQLAIAEAKIAELEAEFLSCQPLERVLQ